MKNFAKILGISLVAIVLIVFLLTGANFLFFWSIFDWIQMRIGIATGLDPVLARAVAAALVSLIVILPTGRIIMAFSPIPQKGKALYRAFVFLAAFAFFILSYFGGREVYFNPRTGEAMKFYSNAIDGGYNFFSEPGFDPLTGDSLLPVTKDIVAKSKGVYPMREAAESPPAKQESIMTPSAPEPPAVSVVSTSQRDEERPKRIPPKRNTSKEMDSPPATPPPQVVYQPQVVVVPETIRPSIPAQLPQEPKYLVSFQNDGLKDISVHSSEGAKLFTVPPGRIRDVEIKAGYYHVFKEEKQVKIIRIQREDTVVLEKKAVSGILRFFNQTKEMLIVYGKSGEVILKLRPKYTKREILPEGVYTFEVGTLRDTVHIKSGSNSSLIIELRGKEYHHYRMPGRGLE